MVFIISLGCDVRLGVTKGASSPARGGWTSRGCLPFRLSRDRHKNLIFLAGTLDPAPCFRVSSYLASASSRLSCGVATLLDVEPAHNFEWSKWARVGLRKPNGPSACCSVNRSSLRNGSRVKKRLFLAGILDCASAASCLSQTQRRIRCSTCVWSPGFGDDLRTIISSPWESTDMSRMPIETIEKKKEIHWEKTMTTGSFQYGEHVVAGILNQLAGLSPAAKCRFHVSVIMYEAADATSFPRQYPKAVG